MAVLLWAIYDLAILGVVVEALLYQGPGTVRLPLLDSGRLPVATAPPRRGWVRSLLARARRTARRTLS